jgi:hypothetical protein
MVTAPALLDGVTVCNRGWMVFSFQLGRSLLNRGEAYCTGASFLFFTKLFHAMLPSKHLGNQSSERLINSWMFPKLYVLSAPETVFRYYSRQKPL